MQIKHDCLAQIGKIWEFRQKYKEVKQGMNLVSEQKPIVRIDETEELEQQIKSLEQDLRALKQESQTVKKGFNSPNYSHYVSLLNQTKS